MASGEEEPDLREVVLQNARSIEDARRRVERELEEAKRTLELRSNELARSLAMLLAALEATTDGLLLTDGTGRITGSNRRFAELWRLPPDVLETRAHRRLLEVTSLQCADPSAYLARVEEIYVTEPTETFDLLELADGRSFERHSRTQVVDGCNVGRVWSLRDVTERVEAQRAHARLAAIIESSQDAIISKGLDGIIQSWNREAELLFGYKAQEAIGRHITMIIPADRQDEEREIMERLKRGERVEHFDTVRVTKSGHLIELSLTISPVRDAQGRPIGASKVARDITGRRQAEAALRDADRRKDEFLALLAHELRNPLAPLQNGLQIMRLAAADEQAVLQARAMMERQLGHMVRLVDDLLDISRISQNKMELRRARILLTDVLSSAIETARPAIEAAGHALVVSLPDEAVHLDADLTRLAQVFGNLLSNSAKYTAPGGRILVKAERRGGDAVISVQDTGIGLPPDSLTKIFVMFSQVDRSIERATGGLGIGLALVKGLVEMHGGVVTAESQGLGQGSTFTVRLPALVSGRAWAGAAEAAAPSAPQHAGRRVLVVDDNADSAHSMTTLLKLLGTEVRTAHDGLEAVEAAQAFRPELILMDVGMPRLNGYEATRRIREQPWGKDALIVTLTGWGQAGDKARSQEAGCDDHMVKPIKLAEVERLLARLAERDSAS